VHSLYVFTLRVKFVSRGDNIMRPVVHRGMTCRSYHRPTNDLGHVTSKYRLSTAPAAQNDIAI